MRNELIGWLENNELRLLKSKIITDRVNFSPDSSPNPSLSIDHISNTGLGRVSIWESGELDLEVIDIDNGDQLLFEHHELTDMPDFDLLLKRYFGLLTGN